MVNKKSFKILVVDDDADLLELCVDAFDMEGHVVVTADGAEKALELLSHESFDVILSDAKMPVMSGEEFFYRAKELLSENLPPFLISTGAIDINERQLKADGLKDIIMKPYDVDELISKVLINCK